MSSTLHLREAGATDLESLLAVQHACVGAPCWSEAIWRQMLSGQPSCERVVMLAEEQGQLLGFVVAELAVGIGTLESIAVREESRGHGVGYALGMAAMDWARARGAEAMELEMRASNTAALRLYRRLGFTEQGLRPGYYSAPAEDAVLMTAALA